MKLSTAIFAILFVTTLFDCMLTSHLGTNPFYECVYNGENGFLVCNQNNSAYINCSAVSELGSMTDYDFGVFRLGWSNVQEAKRFWIYSFNITDNSSIFNQTLSINNGSTNLFVYSADKFIDYGIRVTDFVCFEQFFTNLHVEQAPVTTTKRSRRIFNEVFTNKYGSYWWGK